MIELHIKNMVCPRCVMAVRQLLGELGIAYSEVTLGLAQITQELSPEQFDSCRNGLESLGFELIDDSQNQCVEQVRTAVISWVRKEEPKEKLSFFLQHALGKDYSTLSKLFSQMRGITIERYCILQRIEFAKELLCYSQLNISEVAYRLGYSSPAHLSTQFKQETGMTPTAFVQQSGRVRYAHRVGLDEI